MVPVVIILVFTSMRLMQSLDVIDSDKYDLLENWGITRVKRQNKSDIEKMRDEFKEVPKVILTCARHHKTDEAPFTALVLYKTSGRFLCMGSIIDHEHILSARKCYEKLDVTELKVLLGFAKPWWGEGAQIVDVEGIIKHEYEVAILKLGGHIMFTEYIQAVKLPGPVTSGVPEIITAFKPPYTVVGIFVDRFDVPGDFIAKEKTYVLQQDKYLDIGTCKKKFTKLVLDKTKLFCTLGNATYCWGARGSPVLKKVESYFVQIGVVIADNCTSAEKGPSLVARTDVYGEWIRTHCEYDHQPT